MSRRLGLIIGANNYQDTTFGPLQYAENDARALAQWLVNTKGGKWSPADVQLVQGAHATKELAESLVSQMCLTLAEPGDLALIYFAGHAFLDERSGDGYLALSNTNYQNPATGLHLLSLARQILSRSRAAHILVILDCFQNGPTWQMRRSSPYDSGPLAGPTLTNMLQQQGDRLLLCSCRGNEMAAEAGERGLGLLMYRMILGLSGAASDGPTELIRLQKLHAYLFSTLGEQQRPQLFGQERTPIILVGETPLEAQPQQAAPFASSRSANPGTSTAQRSGSSLFKQPMGQAATATAQLSPSTTTPPPLQQRMAPPTDQQRQQQSQFMLNQAQQMVTAQNYTEALSLVNRVLQMIPQENSALVLKGQILGTMGRFQEALFVVDQLTQLDSNNALAWSMRAVLLSNMQQFQDALTAIDRSLALDSANPETGAIKSNIIAAMAMIQNQERVQPRDEKNVTDKVRGGALSLFIGIVIQIVGLVVGVVGILLPALLNRLPAGIGLFLAGLGMSLLCVNAARGAYRYGWTRLFPTFLLSIVTAGIFIFGGLLNLVISNHTPANAKLLGLLQVHPSLIIPIVVLGGWLIAATIVPPLLAIGGLVGGIAVRQRKHSK